MKGKLQAVPAFSGGEMQDEGSSEVLQGLSELRLTASASSRSLGMKVSGWAKGTEQGVAITFRGLTAVCLDLVQKAKSPS